ncbi:hypothetical protein HHK36_029027 [Tetracentron sinense]|uniref:Uncharacterized protein n=1 Tax=Tetracentron sinense TaxID=13715 RepID=A0A835D370_TETSI|nr:hypothetical protein HHK36_029027 [Tetracentron sinense]
MPDFARVYRFIGSVFDPNTSGHLQRLKKMNPIDLETLDGSVDLPGISVWTMDQHLLESSDVNNAYFLAPFQVVVLMRNLSVNLSSPDFEDHVSDYRPVADVEASVETATEVSAESAVEVSTETIVEVVVVDRVVAVAADIVDASVAAVGILVAIASAMHLHAGNPS